MPSKSSDKPIITDNRDGTVSIKYDPKVEGVHELHIKYNHEHVQGSPYKFHIDNISSGYVTACGEGLARGNAGDPCNFIVYTRGGTNLSVHVDGPTKSEVNCHDNKDGSVSVSYIPPAPGEYKVSVKLDGKHIKDSPYTVKIAGEGRKRSQVSVMHSSEVSINCTEKDLKTLNASIVAPSGLEEPCFLKRMKDGLVGISFTPREKGEHSVNVKRLGNHVKGSPFKILVAEKEIGDASKVKVYGNALKDGETHVENEFVVETTNAGYGGLNFSIEGPSKADINYEDKKDGTIRFFYTVTEPGYYIANLKFADHHVKGSPSAIKIIGEKSNIQRETIKRFRKPAPVVGVGNECRLFYKMAGTVAFDMAAKFTAPNGDMDDAEIIDKEDSVYAIHFVPKEVGNYAVSVRYKDMHIPGSPFQYTVGPFLNFGAHRVHAGGFGLERGLANEPCEFNVWTREAGAGTLAISMEGPSKAELDMKDLGDDQTALVSYIVTEPGNYRIGIKFNDEPIPDSPFNIFVMAPVGEARKIELGRMPDSSALQVNKPIAFNIQMNGAKGMLDGKTISPSGVEDDCFVAPVDEDQWALRFIPRENGIYYIHICLNNIHIRESPFRVLIGKDDADPAAVTAYGNGLKEARSGAKTDFIVDTCSAGAGQLVVTVEGPSHVTMDWTEVEEGYKFRYTPLAPGDYYINIKYNGYHIVGSPFKVHSTGSLFAEPGLTEVSSLTVDTVPKQAKHKVDHLPQFRSDASRVTCKGHGLKKAMTHKNNQFTVNCLDAGNNFLFVSLYGPKGPCDELSVKHMGRNLYQVGYVIKDRGDYALIVKWGDDHIPGSPFRVEGS
ncbi:filamin-A-like [Centruroides vittatus]|uniref:filamin-A-like n=1 Tax=Centruroides vittatus TaxID=120091 RepID=UPI00350EFE71